MDLTHFGRKVYIAGFNSQPSICSKFGLIELVNIMWLREYARWEEKHGRMGLSTHYFMYYLNAIDMDKSENDGEEQ